LCENTNVLKNAHDIKELIEESNFHLEKNIFNNMRSLGGPKNFASFKNAVVTKNYNPCCLYN